jgi:hypothetical protein
MEHELRLIFTENLSENLLPKIDSLERKVKCGFGMYMKLRYVRSISHCERGHKTIILQGIDQHPRKRDHKPQWYLFLHLHLNFRELKDVNAIPS